MRKLLIACLLLCASSMTAAAQDRTRTFKKLTTFENPAEAMEQSLGSGFSGAAEVRDGMLVLKREASEKISLNTTELNDAEKVAVSVDIAGRFDANDGDLTTGAGIVLRYSQSPERTSFYYLLLQKDGTVTSGTFNNGMSGVRTSSSIEGYEPGKPVRLSAVEDGGGVAFYANGERVSSLTVSGIKGRRAGLVLFGGGEFRLDNFLLDPDGSREIEGLPPLADSLGFDEAEPQVAERSEGEEEGGEGVAGANGTMLDHARAIGRGVAYDAACPHLDADFKALFTASSDSEKKMLPQLLKWMKDPRFAEAVTSARKAVESEGLNEWQACAGLIETVGSDLRDGAS